MLRILSLVLVVIGYQVAHAEIVEINRAGPTCDPYLLVCNLVLQINGEITEATVSQLEGFIDKTRRKADATKSAFSLFSVELNSPGGSVDAAMAIGRIMRKNEAGTFVNRGAICFSSCVLILAGGSFRSFEGKIGIHRPYFPVPSGDVSAESIKATYQKTLQDLRTYLREMNVVEGLADAMLRVEPENLRLLGEPELANYGITPVDPIAREAYDLQAAKSNGVDRQEYMRRQLLAETRCGGPTSMGSNCYRSILKNGLPPSDPSPDFSRYGRPAQ
jgi:hypothetical protein